MTAHFHFFAIFFATKTFLLDLPWWRQRLTFHFHVLIPRGTSSFPISPRSDGSHFGKILVKKIFNGRLVFGQIFTTNFFPTSWFASDGINPNNFLQTRMSKSDCPYVTNLIWELRSPSFLLIHHHCTSSSSSLPRLVKSYAIFFMQKLWRVLHWGSK